MKTVKPKRGFMDVYKTYDTSAGFGNSRQWRSSFYEKMTGEEAATLLKAQEATPHEILGVSANATQAEIKSAFRKLITIWHPDKNPHNTANAEAMSKKIIAAYTILSNQKN